MNAMEAFLGLLLLAYLGSILMGGRAIVGYGLPSGSEYLLLGVVTGPAVLGVFDRETQILFDPILQVGLGWLAMITGVRWGVIGGSRHGRAGILLSSFGLAVFACALVSGAVFLVSGWVTPFDFRERLLLAGAAGAVGTETTRIAVRWVFERHGATGPLSRLIAALSDSDELPALLLVAFLFVLSPAPSAAWQLPPLAWLAVTLLLGVVLGLICVALIGDQLHRGEALSFLLGATLLGTGVCVQLGLAGITALFVFGITLSGTSRHRTQLRVLLQKSEAPVMLPVLLLAGAHIDLDGAPSTLWIVAAALAARLLAKWASGLFLLAVPAARPAGPLLGLGLLSSGVVTICIGVALLLRIRGTIGGLALTLAAATALFGEALGPLFLKRALGRAGELRSPSSGKRTSLLPTAPVVEGHS